MPMLPDIDLAEVGHIAWWNALNHGAAFLDPNQLKSYNGIDGYAVYDNGIEGKLDRDPRLKFRAKTDGWIVVWYDTTVSGDPEDYAFIDGFSTGNVGLYDNVLSQELNSIRKQAGNELEMDFSHEDVKFGDYRDNAPSRYETYQFDNSVECKYGYTEDNVPDAVHLTGRSYVASDGTSVSAITFNGETLVPRQDDAGASTGYEEAGSAGWLDGPGEFHYMAGGDPSGNDWAVEAGVVAVYP